MASSSNYIVKYVYELPYFERKQLCRILDQNDKWEVLAGHQMNLDMLTIMELRRELLRGNSPTDELLTLWGHQNHTVEELFVLLSQMQHYQAMIVLKTFVSSRFHSLIYEGEEYMRNLFGACGSKPSFDGRGGAGQEPDSEEPVTAPSVENRNEW